MNITKGPMLEEYAKNRDIPIVEVLEWANQIVNQPHLCMAELAKTEKERFADFVAYIKHMNANSSNTRIRASIAERKAA